MRAKDLMTTDVITVQPEETVRQVAEILLRHRISALPVINYDGELVGIVSEGDLMRRVEIGTEHRRSWWLDLIATPETRATEYIKGHASRVEDVMTRDVITIDEDTPAARIAALLEEKRIKRVPVTRDGRVIGIVSRADLLRGIAATKLDQTAPDDEAIRLAVVAQLRKVGVRDWLMNVTVSDGVVHLWGGVRSASERRAVRVAAETVRGVRAVEDHLSSVRYFEPE